jgi:predicted enzyme related to lactoylglutathione lyase
MGYAQPEPACACCSLHRLTAERHWLAGGRALAAAAVLIHVVSGAMAAPGHQQQVASCTITLIGTTARVACEGPSAALVSAVAQRGVMLQPGTNVRRGNASNCADSVAAVLRVCTSAAHLVLNGVVVRGVKVTATSRTAALAVVAAGKVTLQNASASGVHGSTAVRVVVGGDLRVLNSTFAGNKGPANRIGGLAVVAGAATRVITFQGCSFLNTAAGIACAFVDMTATRPGGRFEMLGANLFSGCRGLSKDGAGGLYIDASSTVGVDVEVVGKVAFVDNYGGGFVVRMQHTKHGSVTIAGGAVFRNNSASVSGAAVWLALDHSNNGTATIAGNVSFVGNTASQGFSSEGGAVYISIGFSTSGAATIAGGVSFVGNTADSTGGAAHLDFTKSNSITATIDGSVSFWNNSSVNAGGAAFLDLQLCVSCAATIAGGVSFMGNAAGANGGGACLVLLRSTHSTASIAGSASFVNNSAQHAQGGAASIDCSRSKHCAVILAGNTTFEGNVASMGGGASVALYDSDAARVDVNEAAFARNTAISAGGGLVVYANTSRDANLRVAHSRFIGNTVEQGSGGGLVVVSGPPTDDENNIVVFYITDTTFTNNTVSSGTGGGLHVDGTSAVPKSCITSFFAFDDIACPATANLHGVRFEGNSATLGGGMFAINTQCAIASSTFSSNTASQAGGGAYTKGVTSVLFRDVHFSSNRYRPPVLKLAPMCEGKGVELDFVHQLSQRSSPFVLAHAWYQKEVPSSVHETCHSSAFPCALLAAHLCGWSRISDRIHREHLAGLYDAPHPTASHFQTIAACWSACNDC